MKRNKAISLLLVGIMLSATACNNQQGSDVPVSTEVISESTEEVSTEESTEIAENPEDALYDGKLVIDDHFNDGEVPPWGTYANGGIFSTHVENGQYVISIDKIGTVNYGCQVYRDDYELNMGGVYTASFDISCDIERPATWRFQVNGGDYHAYYEQEDITIGPDVQTIVADFTMEEATDPAPRLVFNLGRFEGMEDTPAHNVYLDNFVLTLVDASQAQAVKPLDPPINVKVNQVGYKTNDIKKFVAVYDENVKEFEVCNASDKSVVYTGTFDSEPIESYSGDGFTVTGDFSELKTPGKYFVSIEGIGDSYEFTIANDVYEELSKDVVKMLTLQRCGCELDSSLAGKFAHPVCHDSKATIYGTNKQIDVSGGWHDAGDYGRYVVSGAKTVSDLLLAFEESNNYDGDDFGIPESGNGVPDILDEVRYELDWMLKMQNSEGGVYHKVTCAVFPETVMPEEETDELIVSPVSTTATGDFAAVMAKASVIYKDYDAAFASECLKAAKVAYKYMDANAENDVKGFTNPEEIVTGEYPDTKNLDEYFYAAVELYLATGETSYLDKAYELGSKNIKEGLGWADVALYGMYDYLKADDSIKVNTELNALLKEKLMANAELTLSKSETDSYFCALRSYPWGSNMNVANHSMLYKMAYNISGDEKYNEYARLQLDYLLGVNPVGYCYVTGYGTLTPEHIHHRPSQFQETAMPGMLVGGPNSAPSDPYAKTVLKNRTAGMNYVDNDTAFSVNEITIYWNSPLVYVLGMYK